MHACSCNTGGSVHNLRLALCKHRLSLGVVPHYETCICTFCSLQSVHLQLQICVRNFKRALGGGDFTLASAKKGESFVATESTWLLKLQIRHKSEALKGACSVRASNLLFFFFFALNICCYKKWKQFRLCKVNFAGAKLIPPPFFFVICKSKIDTVRCMYADANTKL